MCRQGQDSLYKFMWNRKRRSVGRGKKKKAIRAREIEGDEERESERARKSIRGHARSVNVLSLTSCCITV